MANARIYLTDTTLRDGLQGGIVMDAKAMVQYYLQLNRFSCNSGLIQGMEMFSFHEEHIQSIKDIHNLRTQEGFQIPIVPWMHALRVQCKGLELFKDHPGEVALYIPFEFWSSDRNESLKKLKDNLSCVKELGMRPTLHLEAMSRLDASKTLTWLGELDSLVGIQLSDTFGECLPTLQEESRADRPNVTYMVKQFVDYGYKDLTFHGHNNLHIGTANALEAMRAGCSALNCTMFGIGERAGNVPLEGIAFILCRYGIYALEELDFSAVPKLQELLNAKDNTFGMHYPMYGDMAFSLSAGKLASRKQSFHETNFWRSYESFDPTILGRAIEPCFTADCGRTATAYLIREAINQELDIETLEVKETLTLLKTAMEKQQTSLSWKDCKNIVLDYFAERNSRS